MAGSVHLRLVCEDGPAQGSAWASPESAGRVIYVPAEGKHWAYLITDIFVAGPDGEARIARFIQPT